MEEKSPKGTLLVIAVLLIAIVGMWLLVYTQMLRQG
ncbi:cytochrome c oxidase subunit 2A [Deinococcus cellulosilyticus]|nr:cytochrome c oxidase subunit 2A [Deinococcus cellulosilyticus]